MSGDVSAERHEEVVVGASPDPVPEARVAHAVPKVSPKTHDEQVLKILGDL